MSNPKKLAIHKRLIVCCDGTGQSSSHDKEGPPTNVTRLCRALKTTDFKVEPEEQQIVLYQTGIGTDTATNISGTIAETFGVGLDTHVLEAYNFFANNYEKGDKLFLFGFSRGAYTARSVASFICNAGLLKSGDIALLPGLWKAYKQRDKERERWDRWLAKGERQKHVPIEILGVWDTVGSLGVPETWVSDALKFTKLRTIIDDPFDYHDTSLPARSCFASIKRAYQALALDELRRSFQPTLLYTDDDDGTSNTTTKDRECQFDKKKKHPKSETTMVRNCWFAGVHTDIGGGYNRNYRDISDLTLFWMLDQIGDALAFKKSLLDDLQKAPPQPESEDNRNFVMRMLRSPVPEQASNISDHKPKLKEDRWGLSGIHDSMTLTFKPGGSKIRTPGEYVHCEADKGTRKHNAIEYIHPSVRLRMLQKTHKFKNGEKEDKKEGEKEDKKEEEKEWDTAEPYRPQALTGFDLRETVVKGAKANLLQGPCLSPPECEQFPEGCMRSLDPTVKRTWVKKSEKDGGEIILPEHVMSGKYERLLLQHTDWDVLDNQAAETISVPKPGWGDTFRSWNPLSPRYR